MYVKFSCPLCQSSNFIAGTPLGESGFYPEMACRACKSLIIWVGSERVAALKRTGVNDARVKVDRGVLATLADAEAGVAIGSKQDAADLMETETVGAAVADIYSQGERIKEFSPTDKSVQEGVCNGQSLHWIRRVLQGGRAEYKVLEKKTKSTSAGVQEVTRNTQTIDAKRKAQHMGGVVAQKATEPAELKTYSSSAYADYSKAWDLLDKKWDAATEVYEAKMLQLGGTKQPNGNWSYFVNDKTNAVIQERDTVQSFVKQEKSKLTQAKAARESAGSYQPYWDKISKNLDAQLLEASVAKQKRPFSGIVALKSLNRETCAGGTTAFADKLLVDTDFKVGVCALVSAGLKIGIGESGGKISGHAIAVHYAKSNLLRIFDPNIGVFTCTSKGRLKAALVAMIDVGWVKVFGWQLDDQFGYALFEARPSAVDLPSQQQAVHYTASAETTAIQNKTVIPSSTQAPMVAPSKPAVVIKKPVAPTAGTGPVGAKLSDRLDQVLKNGQKIAKVGGREAPTYEGTGAGYDQWVKLDKQLVDGIISAKVAQGNAGLKGNNTLGEPIARGALAQIIGFLQARGL